MSEFDRNGGSPEYARAVKLPSMGRGRFVSIGVPVLIALAAAAAYVAFDMRQQRTATPALSRAPATQGSVGAPAAAPTVVADPKVQERVSPDDTDSTATAATARRVPMKPPADAAPVPAAGVPTAPKGTTQR